MKRVMIVTILIGFGKMKMYIKEGKNKMLKKEKIEKIIKLSLVADTYSLGAHWVYDEEQLKNLPIDWEELNAPQALWHKGKVAGDFTHIGDQAYWLYEFLQNKDKFISQEYFKFWQEKMSSYAGYIDGATRDTLENVANGKMSGSNSHDFSVVGRISPLLLVSKDEAEFLQNVEQLVKLSHDNEKVIEVAKFFAKVLLHVNDEKDIQSLLSKLSLEFSQYVQTSVKEGIESKDKDTFKTIREFGPACDVDEGFRGAIHLLVKYQDNLKELLIQNAKAGGDSSSRSMIVASIIAARRNVDEVPLSWYN
jgi:ADP-ribosylglycohydrolase